MTVSVQGIENRYEVPDIIAKESLYRLKHHLVLPQISHRTYEKYFEKKIGDTITIKRPFFMKATKGRILSKSAMIDRSLTLKLDQRWHVGLEMVDEDATLRIEDYGRRYLDSGMEELAYQYDIAGANELGDTFFMTEGTPGTEFNVADAQDVTAQATQMAIPRSNNCFALMDPRDIAAISKELQGNSAFATNVQHVFFNEELVGQNIRKKFKGTLSDWHIMESIHVPPYKVSEQHGTPLIDGANQRGSSIVTDGWDANSVKVLNKGTLIQIANVNQVQPRGDRRKTGRVMTFVVTADVNSTSDGHATIPIWPDINAGTSADTIANPSGENLDGTSLANLDMSAFQTVDAIPANNAAITIVGGSDGQADREYRQSIFFCSDALEYVNVTLARPKSANYFGVETDEETGVSISYAADFNVTESSEIERADIFFGVKNIYPEIGIRYIGKTI